MEDTTTNVPNHKERRSIADDARARARVWKTVRAASRLADGLKMVGKGVYEIRPELVIALRQACEDVAHLLRQHDAELMEDTST
jgi:hypothetical protein